MDCSCIRSYLYKEQPQEWDEFKTYDWQKIYDGMLKPAFIFDGRNILDQVALETIGFTYKAIGR
jgi:UDPglucose 6-dehydrogenase